MMAHAWTRMKRRPGVAMGCSGPGTTNLVTGVANAWVDAAPLVAIGGSSPRVMDGMEAFQDIDQVGVMRPITKWAERILDPQRIPDYVETAFRQATTGRPGPVYLDLPGDVLGRPVEESALAFPGPWRARAARPLGDPAAIEEAVRSSPGRAPAHPRRQRRVVVGRPRPRSSASSSRAASRSSPRRSRAASSPRTTRWRFLNARAKAFSRGRRHRVGRAPA